MGLAGGATADDGRSGIHKKHYRKGHSDRFGSHFYTAVFICNEISRTG